MADEQTKREFLKGMTPEVVEAQGKNDREYLTLRTKLVLEAMEKHPKVSIDEIVKIVGVEACGQGCCCCC